MRHPSRLLATLAFLALLPMAAAAGGRDPLDAKKTMEQIEKRLRDVRKDIDSRLKNDPAAHAKAVGYIQAAETQFRNKLESFSAEPNYPIEAEYLGKSFKALILDSFGQVVSIMQVQDLGVRRNRMQSFMAGAEDRASAFDRKFQRDHPDDVRAAVTDRAAWRKLPPPDVSTDEIVLRTFKTEAPLIKAGAAIYEAVVVKGPDQGGSSPNGGTGGSGGNAGNGGSGGNVGTGGSVGNGGAGAAPPPVDWGGIVRQVASVGAPRDYASSAGAALKAGRYGEALGMAGAALELDPKNRDALAVQYAASGRGAAGGASAAAMTPARSGAAALTPGAFSGEAVPGDARPSAEIAAAAASGAARLAAVQAQNGAKSALKLGDAAGALDILNKALLQDPANPALLHLRAQTYGRLGRWEDALADAVAGLALAPGNMALLNTKALSENRTRRWREALATADRMIAADPRSAWGYANRAHAYAGMGLRDKMLADINYAASLDPSFAPAAAEAAALLLPSEEDVMFLFPGEPGKGGAKAPAAASPGRGRSFSVVMGAGLFGGLLLALGLLSIVMAPLKDAVVSVFTRAKRSAPRQAAVTAEPASVAGNVGGLIRGQYEISKQIGAGGMGMVYQGTDRSLGRRVAIKKMREELRLNPRERERFIIEAKTVASLHHPNIVDIYAIAEEGEDVYLVFEFVDGRTVHDLVQAAGRLAVADAVGVTRAMGEALTYAHSRGVIHRDMKPSNVMRTATGQVKVMDFGIARLAKDAATRYSMTNTVVGTPPYMAPEQEQGVVRKESDVYALAICAYEMLTGKLPFIGIGAGMLMNKINMSYIPPSRNIAGLPESLDEVFLKAFQADPDRRYRTPAEFVAALAAAADGALSKSI